jgi:hypothetical protein
MTNQDMCPICSEPFETGETLIRYLIWKTGHPEAWGHFECVMSLAASEKRDADASCEPD